jgi:phosphopantothenoylcysteine decarboxylase/phosphopantothenate--cysteine ligase
MWKSKMNILIGVTGSIAAYKTAALCSRWKTAGHNVKVVATPSALKFVGNATFEGLTGEKVQSEIFNDGQMMDHIHLARWADVYVIAPCTAETLSQIATGSANNLVSTLALAYQNRDRIFLAPAMNTSMWDHPAVQNNLEIIRKFGIQILNPADGRLACGETGAGKMMEPDLIATSVENALLINVSTRARLRQPEATISSSAETESESATSDKRTPQTNSSRIPKCVLITCGGTKEYIDGVRAITNSSTGHTGIEIAKTYARHGHKVHLLAASDLKQKIANSVSIPANGVFYFDTFLNFQNQFQNLLLDNDYDQIIHAAALSDYSVEKITVDGLTLENPKESKIQSGKSIQIELKPNPKIISMIESILTGKGDSPKAPQLIGFKLTNTNDLDAQLKAVLDLFKNSVSQLIVQNDVSNIGSDRSQHPFHIFDRDLKSQTAVGAHSLAEHLMEVL